jgi:hypothetical protein
VRCFAFACFFAVAAIIVACTGGPPPAPPDLVTINGQVVQGTVPATAAVIYATDHSEIAAAFADASLYPPPSPIIADGTGHFSVFGFGSSYDLVAFPTIASHDATVVQNLTRRDPLITLPLPQNTPVHTCHVAPIWTTTPPADATIAYFLQPPVYPGVELVSVVPVSSNPADGLTATWRGSFSTTVNVWAVVFTKDAKTGLPSSYGGFATAYTWLIDAREASITFSLQTNMTSSVTLNFQAPSGYSVETADLAIDFGVGSTSFDLAHFDTPTGTVSVDVPDLPANRLLARGTAKNGGETSSAVAVTGAFLNTVSSATLTFPSATSLVSPNDGANVDMSTNFSWSGSGVNEIIFTSTDPGAPQLRVITAAQAMTLGQFQALTNAQIPPGAHYSWMAQNWPNFPTTDAFETGVVSSADQDAGVDPTTANNSESAPRSLTFGGSLPP